MWRGVVLLAGGCAWLAYFAPTYDQLQHPVGELGLIVVGAAAIGLGLVVIANSRMPSW